jgi:CHAT domain
VPSILQLEVTDFAGPATWQWQLCGPDDSVIAAHNVTLDMTSWQYEAIADLHGYLRLHAAPDRRLPDEARIIALVGEWLGQEVFGPIANAIVARAPVTVEVVLPTKAHVVAHYPLESAVAGGKALAVQQVSLVFVTGAQGHGHKDSSQRLRVLGVFSVPDGSGALNLRTERYDLDRMLTRAAATRDLEFRILQYGVTRERLRQVAGEAEGWDIVHVSGHGKPGAILLETAEGRRDLVGAADLVAILQPAARRLRLLTLSACSSASLAAEQQLYLLGLGPEPHPDSGGGTDGNAAAVLAADLARELDCAVLAMRYPVGDEFAASLAGSVYGLLINEHATLASALQRSLPPLVRTPSPRCPAISLATPALFGRRAARDFFGSHGAGSGSAKNSLPAPFPSQPERFVGRVGTLARAGSVLAPCSGRAGIVLYGMAGAGKSACALELAYTHRESFQGVAWFAAPAARRADPVPVVTDFLAALAAQLPDFGLAHLVSETEAVSHLPELTGWAEQARVLIVIDNAESLLDQQGRLDASWARVLGALAAHHGLGRLVVTSRNPLGIPGLREEAVHALSRDEAVLMAGALPSLRRLMMARGAGATRDRQAVARVLEISQGHPKLLELADGQAGDPDGLTRLLTDGDRTWQELGGLPRGFFTGADSHASGEDYAEVLGAWTAAITGRLERNARLFFEFLCAIEEPDLGAGRVRLVTETAWRDVWWHADGSGRPPRAAPMLRALDSTALAAVERGSDGTARAIRIHPVVAAATRDRTPAAFRRQVDTVMAELWVSVLRGSNEGAGEATDKLVTAARAAVPYALRLGAWDVLGGLISAVAYREASPVTAATMLPAARRLVQSTHGTNEHLAARDLLAHLSAYTDPAAALGDQSQILADAVAAGRYDIADSVATDLVSGYRAAGRLAEALETAQTLPEFSRMAGNGPWTQLANERARLQVLTDQGRHEQAAVAVDRLLAAADALPAEAGPDEKVQPWQVIENMLETGYSAAVQAGDWKRALALLDRRAASQRQRNAPPHEVALTAFNTYGPLLQLGRTDDAVAVLSYCRGIFEGHRDVRMLGKVLSALAQAEESRRHGDSALSHARDALRLSYAADGPREIAANHANYGVFTALHGADLTTAAAHLIAAALVLTAVGDAQAEAPLRAISALCARPVTIPDDVAAVTQLVNAPDGVRFDRLLAGVLPGAAAQQRALRHLLTTVGANGPPQPAAHLPR